jgi:hypothetical protein
MLHPPCSYLELSPGLAVGPDEPSQIIFFNSTVQEHSLRERERESRKKERERECLSCILFN